MSFRPKTIPPAPREAKLTMNEVKNMLMQSRTLPPPPPPPPPPQELSEAEMVRALQRKGYTVTRPRGYGQTRSDRVDITGDWEL
jgi:hypothetical protein